MTPSSRKGTEPHNDGAATTVDAAEVAGFEAIAAEWWDPGGKFRPLHRLNPVRIRYIRDHVCAHFDRSSTAPTPFEELSLLDIGTGGGLVAEPMARLGAKVTAIDPSQKNIAIARSHAAAMGLDIDYRAATAEELAGESKGFDIVLALEVVEHVADLGLFLRSASALIKPGGIFFAATLNRTARAFALAVIGAEYVLGWLPRGTHDWNRFVKPDELTAAMAACDLRTGSVSGVVYNPITGNWRLSGDTAVNYMVFASKPA